ncbi:MAG TPA: cell envelope integrity protein TolA [Xanthobacteraceae bacterium]
MTATHYDESETTANLSQKDIAAFKAHLQKCWSPPADLAGDGQLMAVLRVALKPNGTLAGDPTMLAASASSNGPALLQTAVRALRQCQPYGFLPSAKYKEWKVLDLSFSPTGLSTRPALVSGFDNH